MKKEKKKVFVNGPIDPQFISSSIASHGKKTDIGAQSVFLGQVRNDLIDGKQVTAIEYSAYESMAEQQFYEIREDAFRRFDLTCLHIYHSIGIVKTGEISLFVFVSAVRRVQVFDACSFIVEEIKNKVPVWGKEIMEDGTYHWKSNTINSGIQ